jgi:hypothetical protein
VLYLGQIPKGYNGNKINGPSLNLGGGMSNSWRQSFFEPILDMYHLPGHEL